VKVAIFGLDIQPGKYKYVPDDFNKLVEKFSPKKVTPYTIEFLADDFDKADAVIFGSDKKLDLILLDLDKAEKRLDRTDDDKERIILNKIQKLLEEEILLCDVQFSEEEETAIKHLQFVTFKPALGKDSLDDTQQLIREIMDKAGVFLFYTAGKREVRAWELKKGSTVLTAAAKIHSDLARGFIKAEVVNSRELDNFFNLAEAKAKGLVIQVDRDYVVQPGDIIEIKFNV
jgi:ribosome-binding ATPase YchF (GTP1/OBG family)